ncbi:MAG: GNAT family N-acetyltransferase [Sphingomonas sp.]|uniref:GNAT family N-acetyltransferase n=1 Tax=Sphingomonas sp. TaxID=28214 RepID=UPI001AC865E1|nr:GNAT family N-acetyltransferase [Sphingomonas sp.]MBN8808146.1 GNAT family N-acetyltransferase [Sphingomonas sp.]
MSFVVRTATADDIPTIGALMDRAIDALQRDFLTPDQVAASRHAMGLDTQLIADGTYVVVEDGEGRIVGCGGWSWRATLYGGDHNAGLRDAAPLDPARDPARIRAMYTDPDFVRRGIGRIVLAANEAAARAAGFGRAELMATLAGEPLYLACGYAPIERVDRMAAEGVAVPGVRMGKTL